MRLHLFEFEDLSWFPNIIREGMMDYLKFILGILNFYKPITPYLLKGLKKSGQNRILDLCSGGGGSIIQVQNNLAKVAVGVTDFPITLSDKYPNVSAFEHIQEVTKGKINFIKTPVDATNIPGGNEGLRTMFSAIHHFRPPQIKEILKNAIDNGRGIAFFDGGNKNLLIFLGILIIHPIVFFFCTPFFKPFRLSRLLFTYIIPLIPLCTIWDGLVSILRLYEPNDMKKIVNEIDSASYHWEMGKVGHRLGFKVSFLLGYQKA